MMRRCLLVAALVVAVGCGASSPTQPDPQPPSGGGTPIIDARTACGLSPTHRDRTSVLSIDLGVVAQPLDIGGFAPSDRAGKWYVRVSWSAGQPSITFDVRVTGADAATRAEYDNRLMASSTSESATSATACITAPAGVYVNLPARFSASSGVVTPTVAWAYPQ
jgi:hypothetical protein